MDLRFSVHAILKKFRLRRAVIPSLFLVKVDIQFPFLNCIYGLPVTPLGILLLVDLKEYPMVTKRYLLTIMIFFFRTNNNGSEASFTLHFSVIYNSFFCILSVFTIIFLYFFCISTCNRSVFCLYFNKTPLYTLAKVCWEGEGVGVGGGGGGGGTRSDATQICKLHIFLLQEPILEWQGPDVGEFQ